MATVAKSDPDISMYFATMSPSLFADDGSDCTTGTHTALQFLSVWGICIDLSMFWLLLA